MCITLRGLAVESDWRDEALRTNLWLIPAIESMAAVALFAVTLTIDRAASHGELSLPSWVISGSPDAARQILSSLAGAIITVVGVVFSIMIVTLTLASTQFGPRMLRMPAVLIRQLDALSKIMAVAPDSRSPVLLDQASMIQRVSQRTVPEPADQADITARYEALLTQHARAVRAQPEPR